MRTRTSTEKSTGFSIFAKKDIMKTKKSHDLRGRNYLAQDLQLLFCEFPHSYHFDAKKSRKTHNFPQPSEFPGSSAQNRISVDKISTKNMRQNCSIAPMPFTRSEKAMKWSDAKPQPELCPDTVNSAAAAAAASRKADASILEPRCGNGSASDTSTALGTGPIDARHKSPRRENRNSLHRGHPAKDS